MSEKSFPASDHKLQRLRDEGRFPASRDLTTAAAVAGLGAGWILLPWSRARELCTDGFAGRFGGLASFFRDASGILLPVLCVVATVVLLSWLIQTRFALRFRSGRRKNPEHSRHRFLRAGLGLAKVATVGVATGFLLVSEIRSSGGEARQLFEYRLGSGLGRSLELCAAQPSAAQCSAEYLLQGGLMGAFSITVAVAACCLIVSFLLGILSRFVAGLEFQYEHRMTRAEIEAEARESESPPLLREMLDSERWPETTEN